MKAFLFFTVFALSSIAQAGMVDFRCQGDYTMSHGHITLELSGSMSVPFDETQVANEGLVKTISHYDYEVSYNEPVKTPWTFNYDQEDLADWGRRVATEASISGLSTHTIFIAPGLPRMQEHISLGEKSFNARVTGEDGKMRTFNVRCEVQSQ